MRRRPKTTTAKHAQTNFLPSAVDSEGAAGNLRLQHAAFIGLLQANEGVGFGAFDVGNRLPGLEGLRA